MKTTIYPYINPTKTLQWVVYVAKKSVKRMQTRAAMLMHHLGKAFYLIQTIKTSACILHELKLKF